MRKFVLPFISAVALYTLLSTLGVSSVQAIAITAGPTLTNTSITAESGTAAGTTVQFTLDTAGQVQVDFFLVSPADSSLTRVASVAKTFASSGAQTVFWNALWLIGTEAGRHNGTYTYQVTPSVLGTPGTALPPLGDATALFTIDSVDIHNVSVSPSFDANHQPTFPYLIQYGLSKTSLVTATITNSSGTLVRTLLSGARQAGESISSATVTWDGLGIDLKPVSIGLYTLDLTAADPSNNGALAIPHSKLIDVFSLAGSASDPQKLFEDNVFVYPNPVRNGQGTFEMEGIRDGATLSLKVYTLSGDLVLDKSFPNVAPGNIQSFTWDVTNQSGRKLGRGLYYYVAKEVDAQGTLQTVKKMAVLP